MGSVERRDPHDVAFEPGLRRPIAQRLVQFFRGLVEAVDCQKLGLDLLAIDPRRRVSIYGTLRGRAMAGVNGNSSARIYCQKIEAELLAIDGFYQTAEELDEALRNRPAQAWLEGEIMRITPLN